jgi:hypothetical protein
MHSLAESDAIHSAAVQAIKSGLSHMYISNQKNQMFAFNNQQIANSPYHLVKGFPS